MFLGCLILERIWCVLRVALNNLMIYQAIENIKYNLLSVFLPINFYYGPHYTEVILSEEWRLLSQFWITRASNKPHQFSDMTFISRKVILIVMIHTHTHNHTHTHTASPTLMFVADNERIVKSMHKTVNLDLSMFLMYHLKVLEACYHHLTFLNIFTLIWFKMRQLHTSSFSDWVKQG